MPKRMQNSKRSTKNKPQSKRNHVHRSACKTYLYPGKRPHYGSMARQTLPILLLIIIIAAVSNFMIFLAAILTPDLSTTNSHINMKPAPVFAYKIEKPRRTSSAVIILLHGAGGNENSLMPFARSVWPNATLVGLRGRIMQGKERRWYHKISPTVFDQKEALRETETLAQFLAAFTAYHHYAPKKMIFVGHSNGANLLAILAMKHPQLVQRAILLRPMPVLTHMPRNNLHNQHILALSGTHDKLYGSYAEPLYAVLKENGAQAVSYRIPATHMPSKTDEKIIRRWLKFGY